MSQTPIYNSIFNSCFFKAVLFAVFNLNIVFSAISITSITGTLVHNTSTSKLHMIWLFSYLTGFICFTTPKESFMNGNDYFPRF